jgi:nucleotide-binding universal stress UspA family protein
MFERILVPLDGSKVGETALPAVEELAQKLTASTKVEVVLLQTITTLTHYVIAGEASTSVPYTEKEVDQIKGKSTEYLENTAQRLRAKGITARPIVTTSNNAPEEIMRVADEEKADLIAMASHGRHGLSRWAFGSVTDKVLRSSTVPVLVVRVPKATS